MRRVYLLSLLLCLFTSTLLTSCENKKKDAHQAVSAFVDKIETASKKSELEKIKIEEKNVHVVYTGSDKRDPFELPEAIKNTKNYENTILRDQSIDNLKLIGIVNLNDARWAIVRGSDGKIYRITEGMRVGLQQALLKKITDNQVVLVTDEESGEEGKREIYMTLQGPKS